MDYKQFTTTRVDGTDRNSRDVKRKGLKIDNLNETKLLNFYSVAGINFQNIASNDAITSSKLNELASEGWLLSHVVSGVEGDAGKDDGNGILLPDTYLVKRYNDLTKTKIESCKIFYAIFL